MRRAIVILFILLPALALAETVHQTEHIELSAEGIDRLEIICGAGSFDLNSVADLQSIRVAAQIEVEDLKRDALQAFIKENVRLNLEKIKNKAILRSEAVMSSIKTKEARVNLSIAVPNKLDVKITDASGPIRIMDFWGNLEIDDDTGKTQAALVKRLGIQQHVVECAENILGHEQYREIQCFGKVRIEAVFRQRGIKAAGAFDEGKAIFTVMAGVDQ